MSSQFIQLPVTGGAGVTSVNSLTGVITLAAGTNVTLNTVGNTITINATGGGGGSGTVTSVSVVSANGFTGTVANPTTTPAITLTGTLTGDVTGTLNSNALTATTNATLVTLSSLSLPYSQLSGTVPTWNQNTTGTAANITASSNSSLVTLSALSLPYSQITGAPAAGITQLTGDGTAGPGSGSQVFTLATVNTNTGSWGSASSVATFTVNGKGLITAASNTAIQITESQVTNLTSDLAGKLTATLASGDIFVGNGSNVATAVAMSGDATLANTGAITLANVATAGTTGSSTAIPVITINAKGLVTGITTAAVVAPAGTLSGTTLNSTVVTSSLTTVGTIGTGIWQGTPVTVPYGGTGATSFTANQIIIGGTTSTSPMTVIAPGTAGYILVAQGSGVPTWQSPAAATGGFAYLASNASVYGGTNFTLSFSGAGNVVVGISAGANLTSGTNNTLYGVNAGASIVTGANNTMVGFDAGQSATSSDNTIIGNNAGKNITSGAQNTALGSGAGPTTATLSNTLALGYQAIPTASNQIMLGNASVTSLVTTAAWNGATVTTGYGGTGQTSYTTGDTLYASASNVLSKLAIGSTGQVLTVVGGLPAWATASSSGGFAYLSSNTSVYGGTNSTLTLTGAQNTIVGVSAGASITSGTDNTLYGYNAGNALTGSDNIIIGNNAANAATSMTQSVVIGSKAINSGVTTSVAGASVAIGYFALNQLTTGTHNTAVGYETAIGITTGTDTTAIGYNAGSGNGSFNTAIGSLSGGSGGGGMTGANNTLVGYEAGYKVTSGNNNVIIGYEAGNGTTHTGASNVIIGSGAAPSANFSSTQSILIGYNVANSLTTGQQNIIIGNSSVANGSYAFNVSIGNGNTVGNSTGGNGNIAIGHEANATGAGSIVIGTCSTDATDGGAAGTIIIGQCRIASNTHSQCFVVGNGTAPISTGVDTTTGPGQIVFGVHGIQAGQMQDMFLGRGAVGDATAPNCSIQPSPVVGSNIAGGNLTLTAGNGTGTGGSGDIAFQTAPVAGSSSTANTLVTALKVAHTGIVTIGAASTTPTHAINTLTSTGANTPIITNCPSSNANPTGWINITVNGTLAYVPYWT